MQRGEDTFVPRTDTVNYWDVLVWLDQSATSQRDASVTLSATTEVSEIEMPAMTQTAT